MSELLVKLEYPAGITASSGIVVNHLSSLFLKRSGPQLCEQTRADNNIPLRAVPGTSKGAAYMVPTVSCLESSQDPSIHLSYMHDFHVKRRKVDLEHQAFNPDWNSNTVHRPGASLCFKTVVVLKVYNVCEEFLQAVLLHDTTTEQDIFDTILQCEEAFPGLSCLVCVMTNCTLALIGEKGGSTLPMVLPIVHHCETTIHFSGGQTVFFADIS
ncbi:hypothetical protein E2C01_036798 [Portunus trituberculatus]|uniref:Uncharacterized protein n=1 Tax=Portunus trituberculatus TaxID=210409 RepID=A0A5B7F6F0_PORTR|nr:hypothetical protein [Portunus trituberculatus]